MNCPYCHSPVKAGSKYCTECGAPLESRSPQPERNAQLAADTGLLLGQAARQARLEASYDREEIIGERAYNGIILAVLLWGLLVNVLLCWYVGDVTRYLNPLVFLIGYLVCAFVGTMIAAKSRKPALSFLGYNLVVVPFGLMISTLVEAYGGVGSRLVYYAFLYTLLISLGMGAAAVSFPKLFEKLGGALLGCLAGLLLCELVLLLFGVRQYVSDWIAAGMFSLYIGFDIHRSQQFTRTVDNAVDCALDIYLDIANLFIRLLRIMGRRKN